MSDEFGPNFITITERTATTSSWNMWRPGHNGVTYMALFSPQESSITRSEEAESAQWILAWRSQSP